MSSSGVQFSIAELTQHLDGTCQGDGAVVVRGVNSLAEAGADDITFITTSAYFSQWPESRAAAAVVSDSVERDTSVDDARPLIVVKNAELAILGILKRFKQPEPVPDVGVHPTAWVHDEAKIHETARIGPHVSVDRGAVIEAGVVLHAGVRIYAEVRVGKDSILHGNCVIRERCEIGQRVILHINVSIGTDGFGYRPLPDGSGLAKMPHIGIVRIEDDVEIGATSCVDRGKFGATVIGQGTKIDNLVQIGHNCVIGRHCVIAASTGLAGSVQMGDFVQVAGCVCIAEQRKIGDGVKIGGGSGVIKDLEAGKTYLGYPTDLASKTLRQWAAVRKLPDALKRISRSRKDPN